MQQHTVATAVDFVENTSGSVWLSRDSITYGKSRDAHLPSCQQWTDPCISWEVVNRTWIHLKSVKNSIKRYVLLWFDLKSITSLFQKLVKARVAERKRAIAEGKMDDPLVPKRLEDAITIVGTCMDMCPRFERYRRERENNLFEWELVCNFSFFLSLRNLRLYPSRFLEPNESITIAP